MPPVPAGCPIPQATGNVGASGPQRGDILFIAEAAGKVEALRGVPLVGPAGFMFDRVLGMAGLERERMRLANCLRCFPGDTLVEATGVEKAYRRWYSGDLVLVTTEHGSLSGTPNHPVLTGRGWVRLDALVESDHLARGSLGERMSSREPHVDRGPSKFVELFNALAEANIASRMVGSHVDFHGDGREGKVDVISVDTKLRSWCAAKAVEKAGELPFYTRRKRAGLLELARAGDALSAYRLGLYSAPPDSIMRCLGDAEPAGPAELLHAISERLRAITDWGAKTRKKLLDAALPTPEPTSECPNTGPAVVGLSKILRIERRSFSGHVFNLQTSSQEYIADGFIVHNCHPPRDWLVGAPWEQAALDHCKGQLEEELARGWKVVVTLGAIATRVVLGLPRARGKEPMKLQDFHGAPTRDPLDRFWVVPTYHPSFLQQGGQKFIKTVVWDLTVAQEIAQAEAWKPDAVRMWVNPPVDQFREAVRGYLGRAGELWCAIDTETRGKMAETDESALEGGFEIEQVNLAWDADEGWTVDWKEPYKDIVEEVLAAEGVKCWWNLPYDRRAFSLAGVPRLGGTNFDFMDAWHVWQSSLPRGLGFVASFYSNLGPWKHLGTGSGKYRCMDAVQTLRAAYGIAEALQERGMWEVFTRHCWEYDERVLRPAEAVGLLFDREALVAYTTDLARRAAELEDELREMVPRECRVLDGPYVKALRGGDYEVVEKSEQALVNVCAGCGDVEVTAKHVNTRAGTPCPAPQVVRKSVALARFYKLLPFNPASWEQVLVYIKHRRHKPGKAKKTNKDTTDKKTLRRLLKTGDPVYPLILEHRAVGKMKGTYGEGMLERMGGDGRVHGHFSHNTSSMRLASHDPNLQNLANHVELAAGFRRCIVAAPGAQLLSFDYSGIEAVVVGWLSGDPDYIRLAKLGVHAYVTTHVLAADGKHEGASLSWSDADLAECFADVKKRFDLEYNASKRCAHGYNYGLTAYGMQEAYPDIFKTRKSAEKIITIYEAVCPKLKPWHASVRKMAHEKKLLGGPLREVPSEDFGAWYWQLITGGYHPFGYLNHLYDVVGFTRDKDGKWQEHLGQDAKRAVSFGPQSIAAGIICEAALRLHDPDCENYIGSAWEGTTPLRAIVHDDLTLEVGEVDADEVAARVVREMTRPIAQMPMPEAWGLGKYLTVGVAAKRGKNWAPWSEKNLEGMRGFEALAGDVWREEEEEDAT